MKKFNVGDKIVLSNEGVSPGFTVPDEMIGKEYTVSYVDNSDDTLKVEGYRAWIQFNGARLAKSKSLAQVAFENLNPKVGDTVKVVATMPNGSRGVNGYERGWNDSMNAYLGKEYEINTVDSKGYAIGIGHFYFPAFALEKIEKPKTKSVVLNREYTAVITKDKIEVGCQTFRKEQLQSIVDAAREMGMEVK